MQSAFHLMKKNSVLREAGSHSGTVSVSFIRTADNRRQGSGASTSFAELYVTAWRHRRQRWKTRSDPSSLTLPQSIAALPPAAYASTTVECHRRQSLQKPLSSFGNPQVYNTHA
jgi:hypothetical protein